MIEKWNVIDEFPNYRVSNYGEVVNNNTGKALKQSVNRQGLVKVGLVGGGIQYTRSVALLVADAFIFGRSVEFDTPIHLDGDQTNNTAENLVWRPRWFAWKYFRQFSDPKNHNRGPVYDRSAGLWYERVIDAAVAEGILVEDIMRSIRTTEKCFPVWHVYSFRD